MALYLLLLGTSALLLRNEINLILKQPLLVLYDCQVVQSSGRGMSIRALNCWTVVTIAISMMYLIGLLIVGALPSRILYHFAFYNLLTTFLDYTFMAGIRDCCDIDVHRWRFDAYLRCAVYSWVVIFVLKNIGNQMGI